MRTTINQFEKQILTVMDYAKGFSAWKECYPRNAKLEFAFNVKSAKSLLRK